MGQYSVRSEQWTTVDTLAEQRSTSSQLSADSSTRSVLTGTNTVTPTEAPQRVPPHQRPVTLFCSFPPLLSHVCPRSERAPAPRISSRQQDSTLFAMLVTARIVGACAPLSPLTTRTRPKPPECVTRRTRDTASHHVRPSSMPSKPAAKMGAKCK